VSHLHLVEPPKFRPTGIERESGGLIGYDPKWYAVFTMPRHEKRVAGHCTERGIESFVPLYQVRHRWKNRCTATVELPLFPNYSFVRMDVRERVQVLSLSSVRYLVSSGHEPLPVPDNYISFLRAGLLAHRIEPHPDLEVGDRVRINTGPMAGIEGILDRHKNGLRIVLKLEMIGRSIAVEVGAAEVSHVGEQRKNAPVVAGQALFECVAPQNHPLPV
jgi:transcription antitermination factor NusG